MGFAETHEMMGFPDIEDYITSFQNTGEKQ